jgi:membrane protein YqaA with SNARE-associated domain
MGDSGYWLELGLMLLSSIVKFVLTPSVMVARGWSFIEIIIVTTCGAALGSFLFYNLGDLFFKWMQRKRRGPAKKFSWKNRTLARVKSSLGLKGLILFSGLISVPITAVLAARYFKSRSTLPLLILGFFLWSLVLTSISMGVGSLFQFLSQ